MNKNYQQKSSQNFFNENYLVGWLENSFTEFVRNYSLNSPIYPPNYY